MGPLTKKYSRTKQAIIIADRKKAKCLYEVQSNPLNRASGLCISIDINRSIIIISIYTSTEASKDTKYEFVLFRHFCFVQKLPLVD